MFRRIRTRLAVLYAGLFALALSLVAVALYVVVATTAERQVRGELVASGTVFDRLWELRTRELSNAAGLLVPRFRLPRRGRDRRSAAPPCRRSTISRRGSACASPSSSACDGSVTGLADPRLRADARRSVAALDAGQTSGVARLGGVPHQVVAAPIMAPSLVGWVVFATELGPPEMRRLEQLSAIPISARVLQRAAGRLVAWSGRRPRSRRFIDARIGDGAPARLDDVGGTSIALVKPLQSMGEGESAALLLRYPLALRHGAPICRCSSRWR